MNKIFFHRPKLKDLLKIKSNSGFQEFLVNEAVKSYIRVCKKKKKKLGSVLVVGANQVEAANLPKYKFNEILLSNIKDPDEETSKAIDKKDSRIKTKILDSESLDVDTESYDYVFCKETLHHLPRPHLGVYEMLRVCKSGVTFIEPRETLVGGLLANLNIATSYEGGDPKKQPSRRPKYGACYVYRWNKKELKKLLTSYYLETGYELHLTSFWLSNRKIFGVYIARSSIFKTIGWLMSFLPFSRGNFLIATIIPGKSKPYEIK